LDCSVQSWGKTSVSSKAEILLPSCTTCFTYVSVLSVLQISLEFVVIYCAYNYTFIQIIICWYSQELRDDRRGSIPGKNKNCLCSPEQRNRLWGPPSRLSNELRGLYPRRVKWAGHEADHSPLPRAQVKKSRATPPLRLVLLAW
jgi:hypothetical protein